MTLADALLYASCVLGAISGAAIGAVAFVARGGQSDTNYFGEIAADPDRSPPTPPIDRLRNDGVL